MKKLTVSLASLILVMSFAVLAFAGCEDAPEPGPSETPLTQQQINEKAQMSLIVAGANMVMGPTDADFSMKLYTESAEQPEATAAMSLQLKGDMEDLTKLSAKLDGTVTVGGQDTALAVTYNGTDLYVAAADVKLNAKTEELAALVAEIKKLLPGPAPAVAVGSVALLAADATAPMEGLFTGDATYQKNEDGSQDYTVNLNLASLKDTVPGIETIFPQPVALAFSVSGDNGPFTSISIAALEIEGKKADLALTFKKAAFTEIAAPADKDTYTNPLECVDNTVKLGYYEIEGVINTFFMGGPYLNVEFSLNIDVKENGGVELMLHCVSDNGPTKMMDNTVYYDGEFLYYDVTDLDDDSAFRFRITPEQALADPIKYIVTYMMGLDFSDFSSLFPDFGETPEIDFSSLLTGIGISKEEANTVLGLQLDLSSVNEMLKTGELKLFFGENALVNHLEATVNMMVMGALAIDAQVSADLKNTAKPENVNVLEGLSKEDYREPVQQFIHYVETLSASSPLTLTDKPMAYGARKMYNKLLTKEQQAAIAPEVKEALDAAVAQINEILQTEAVKKEIEALKAADTLKIEDAQTVLGVKKSYDELSEAAKAKITAELKTKLDAAVAKIDELCTAFAQKLNTDIAPLLPLYTKDGETETYDEAGIVAQGALIEKLYEDYSKLTPLVDKKYRDMVTNGSTLLKLKNKLDDLSSQQAAA